ncbi:MAG TPA: hypothetical protein VFM09_00965 [Marmoricola sp.]|nr:hypothetical protein [Marmoricola sp.]
MPAPRRLRALLPLLAAALLSLGLAPSAMAAVAAVAAPASPVQVGFATISDLSINGVATTMATVDPGSQVSITATVADDHGTYCVSCIDNVPIGLSGAANPAGCLEDTGFTGNTYTNTVMVTAPTEPGVYDVVAEANYTYYCSQNWDGSGTTIAELVVPATSSQLCSMVKADVTRAGVGKALCAKLSAAQRAADRGQTRTSTNILRAFEHQVAAQTGKSLTTDQADLLSLLASLL